MKHDPEHKRESNEKERVLDRSALHDGIPWKDPGRKKVLQEGKTQPGCVALKTGGNACDHWRSPECFFHRKRNANLGESVCVCV